MSKLHMTAVAITSSLVLVAAMLAAFIARHVDGKANAGKTTTWELDPVCQTTIRHVVFRPESFFDKLSTLIDDEEFSAASGLLLRANVAEIVPKHPGVYVATMSREHPRYELPGVNREFDETHDMVMPGTETHKSWQWAQYCQIFAEKYNRCVEKAEDGTTDLTPSEKIIPAER